MTGWVTVAAALGSGVVGGFYVAFSAVVIPALRRRPDGEAAATMVAVNEAAVRAPFMVLFFGTAALCGLTVADAVIGPDPDALLRTAGAAAYLAGWASTMAVNVPLNHGLANGGAGRWPGYQRSWARANHARAVLSVAGAVGLLVSAHP